MCAIWKYPTNPEKEILAEHLMSLPDMPFVNITGGEPFIRDDIEEIVKVLKRKARRIVISTNGYFTDRIIALIDKHPGVGIRISIEGLPKANDDLRGIPDGFDRGLRTLISLKHMGLKDIGFGITVSDRNARDMLELYKLAKAMKVEFATAVTHNSYYFHTFDNRFNHPEVIEEELTALISEFFHTWRPKNWYRAFFNYGLINFVKGRKRLIPCEAGTALFFLDPLGEVRPCNGMEESMGNIKERSFDEIWKGKKAQEIRNKVRGCDKNCWMIGSVAPVMKKHLWIPTKWILENFRKYRSLKSSGKEIR